MRHCQEKNLLKVVVSEGFTITTNYHRIHPYNRRPSAIQGDLITEPGVLVRDMLDLEMREARPLSETFRLDHFYTQLRPFFSMFVPGKS